MAQENKKAAAENEEVKSEVIIRRSHLEERELEVEEKEKVSRC
jgi:hypothetical protein